MLGYKSPRTTFSAKSSAPHRCCELKYAVCVVGPSLRASAIFLSRPLAVHGQPWPVVVAPGTSSGCAVEVSQHVSRTRPNTLAQSQKHAIVKVMSCLPF